MRRQDLERLLGAVPRPTDADPDLEQVRTPPPIAAELLWAAHEDGTISGRRVVDLGCGTGVFSWGAVALGAATVEGVDIDAGALQQAAAVRIPDAGRTADVAAPRWTCTEITQWRPEGPVDTVLMNPPFGAQLANRNADRAFYDAAALALGGQGTAWFLAQVRTEGFLTAMARGHGARIVRVARWDYPLEATYAHHEKAAKTIDVGGYRLSWT